ncbi:MAG: beta strand repeat-containing protein [Parvularculaceae bacterium]
MTITPTLDKAAQLGPNLSGTGGNDQTIPKMIHLDDGRFVLIWTDNSDVAPGAAASTDILMQVYTAFGNPVGPISLVNSFNVDTEGDFSVAKLAGTNQFVVAYEDTDASGTSIRTSEITVAADHTISRTSRTIATDPGADELSDPEVSAAADGSYMVIYSQTTAGTAMSVFGNVVSNTGTVGAQFPVLLGSDDAPGDMHNTIATLTNGNYVMVSENQISPGGDRGLFMRILDSAGASVLGATEVGTTSGDTETDVQPSVAALAGGGFVVVWSNTDALDTDLLFRIYNNAGVQTGTGFIDSDGSTDNNVTPSVVALKDGGFLVVYDDNEANFIRAQRFDASGTEVGTTFDVAAGGAFFSVFNPAATLTDDGRLLISWQSNSAFTLDNNTNFAIYDPRTGSYNGDGGDEQILTRLDGGGFANTFFGGGGNDTIRGRGNVDAISGDAGDDLIYAGGGDDVIQGLQGNDTIDGGAGLDTAYYTNSPGGVTVRLWNGTAVDGHGTNDSLISIEGIEGSNFGDAIVGADNVDNVLIGNGGDDTLFGLSGDDTIRGGSGADSMNGGAGADEVDYSDDGVGVTVRLWNQTATGGIATGDSLAGFEHATGGNGGDAIVGSDGVANRIVGNFGDDTLFGLSGDDTIRGGSGADSMNGGTGADEVDYSDDGVGVTVRLWNQTATGGIATGDSLAGFEHATGGSSGDAIVGSDGVANILTGNGGDDSLYGLTGNDTIDGGAGADVINGGGGYDYASYSDSSVGVKIRLWNGTGELGDAQGDSLTDIEGVVGSDFDDVIVGADGVANTFYAGLGDDTLYGKSGNDTFVFFAGYDNDTIGDFTGGAGAGDVIRLIGLGSAFDTFAEVMNAATQVGANTVINFGGGDSITLLNVTKASLVADDFTFG